MPYFIVSQTSRSTSSKTCFFWTTNPVPLVHFKFLKHLISSFYLIKVADVVHEGADDVWDGDGDEHVSVGGGGIFCEMAGNPDGCKDKADHHQVLSDHHGDEGEALEVVVEGENQSGEDGDCQDGENVLSIVDVGEAHTLFHCELATCYECEADAYD